MYSQPQPLGDYDGDGGVGQADYDLYALKSGDSTASGEDIMYLDIDGGGIISQTELDAVLLGWGLGYAEDDKVTRGMARAGRVENRDGLLPFAICDVGHQGMTHSEKVGLIYNRFRFRDSTTGKWRERDQLTYIDGLSLNQYSKSSPLTYVDPNGSRTMQPWKDGFTRVSGTTVSYGKWSEWSAVVDGGVAREYVPAYYKWEYREDDCTCRRYRWSRVAGFDSASRSQTRTVVRTTHIEQLTLSSRRPKDLVFDVVDVGLLSSSSGVPRALGAVSIVGRDFDLGQFGTLGIRGTREPGQDSVYINAETRVQEKRAYRWIDTTPRKTHFMGKERISKSECDARPIVMADRKRFNIFDGPENEWQDVPN